MALHPLASVIIPSLDGREMLGDCLSGLKVQSLSRDRFEIVIVDNGSADGTADWLAAEHPDVVLVRLTENVGFAAGSNRGAEVASGEHLVFLNNDAVPDSRFLEQLVRMVESEHRPDCVAARILDWTGTEVEFGGASLSMFGFGSQHSSWQRRFVEASAGEPLPFACGGAMLVRADAFERVGGFDADYFAYYEDVDLGWRLWSSGSRVVYAPGAQVRHRRHATGERFSPRWRHFHWYRNALMTLFKNSDEEILPRVFPFAVVLFFQRIGALYRAADAALVAGDAERAASMLECAVGAADGIGWILFHIDELWDKRRRVQASKRRPDRELAELFDISLDFGAEAGDAENARALRMVPFVDLSVLYDPERARAAAASAASSIANDIRDDLEKVRFELEHWHSEATRLGTELHSRNLELLRLHADLHARNLEIQELHERHRGRLSSGIRRWARSLGRR